MKPDIVVIGSLGNVGSEVVNALLAKGSAVRAADRSPEKVRQRYGSQVEAVPFDFANPATFSAAFEGMRACFLLRPPQISDVKKYILPALEAAQDAGLRQIVFLSLIGIENNKIVPHYKIEEWLVASGLDYTFLRCSFFMQNLNTTHQTEIREQDEIYVPVGTARTSFLDVRDIGAVAALALTQPGHEKKAYDLTGGASLDYYRIADMFSQILGRQIVYKNPSTLSFFIRQAQRKSGLIYALVTTWLYSNTRSGMADKLTGEVERLLGRKPVRMEQYILDYRDCWMKSSHLD